MNALFVNFDKNQLVMTRQFAQKCRNTQSPEYAQLQSVRRDYPGFAVITREIKKNPNKECYKGLTYQYMEDYIITHESDENRKAVLNEFNEKRLISACHSKAFRYPVIKQWFLEKYPEVATFGRVADSVSQNNITNISDVKSPIIEDENLAQVEGF